ncbi:MAG: DNA repair protein RecN [Proteobacteria bacterium]|jgi:DNA repair protein RecN (Recombination protein N)|nr:DNA repair protein RecN [Alphaproteobacteria bacterium]NCC02440.1 DNA repair protein RecN [Pseudomonadota bacterium]
MLARLTIQNVVLIDKLVVPFKEGLNVLTGETGAGKSILLDSLGLALGGRSEAALVRKDAEQATVTAEFTGPLPASLATLLREQSLEVEEPLILRRIVGKDGKSRACLCDQPVSIALLKNIGESLVEIHGQFETHGLLNPANHRMILDAFASVGALKQKVAQAYEAWHTAVTAHQTALQEQERAQAEEDFLKAAVAELNNLAPQEDEIDKLAQQRTTLQHREKLVEALETTESALSGERGAVASLSQAGKTLSRIADKAPDAQKILEIIDRAASDLDEATHQLSRMIRDIGSDTTTLESIEERLFKLRAVARKHNVPAETLHKLQTTLAARLDLLMDQGEHIAALAKEAMKARAAYHELALKLSNERTKAAEKLAQKIMQELPPLKLERAIFKVECTPMDQNQWNAEGMDKITFTAATNPGQSLSALNKVASGGELARFMLAIKVVLAKSDPVPTLVFDEVDTGIGGATAAAVGQRLAQLGKDVQVLVVTHSPQVAARANAHLHVQKRIKGKAACTDVRPLDKEERVEEIARMLSGDETTDHARKAAKDLIKG